MTKNLFRETSIWLGVMKDGQKRERSIRGENNQDPFKQCSEENST